MTKFRKKAWRQLILVIGVVCVALFLASQQTWREENQVYEAFLSSIYDLNEDNDGVVVLSNPSTCYAEKYPPIVSGELLDAFVSANSVYARPVPLPALEGRIDVVAYEDAKRLRRSTTAQIEGSLLVHISRIGFSRDGEQALFCGWSAKSKGFFLAHRQPDGWNARSIELLRPNFGN